MNIALLIQRFQKKRSEGPSRWETGRCILDMEDLRKEMVNALSTLMGFYADFVPAFLWRWNSREEWKLRHRSTEKASQDKTHCLIQRDINFVSMKTLHPGWGTILCRRIGQCQDRCP